MDHDTVIAFTKWRNPRFQRMRPAPVRTATSVPTAVFQIMRPVRAATCFYFLSFGGIMFQLTRPCGSRLHYDLTAFYLPFRLSFR